MNMLEAFLEGFFILLMFIVALFLLPFYIICGILDLTYHERHKPDNAENCPYFIEKD